MLTGSTSVSRIYISFLKAILDKFYILFTLTLIKIMIIT